MKITVFTPTYNRGELIKRAYKSLCSQSYKDFEWIVVDQGNDDTYIYVEEMKKQNILNIIYIRKNGQRGINRAFNIAVKIATGEVMVKLDDDDMLASNALERIVYYIGTLEDKSYFAGVAGLRAHYNGDIIGGKWKHKKAYVDAYNYERDRLHLGSDKAEAYFLNVLRICGPMDEVPGETYTWEAILWDRIAHCGYKIRWFNEVIYYGDYLEGGATSQEKKARWNNFKTYSLLVGQRLSYKEFPLLPRIKLSCRYFEMLREKKLKLKDYKSYFENATFLMYLGYICSPLTKYIYRKNVSD